MAMEPCQWRSDILRDLQQRNKRESGGFSELIASRKYSRKRLCVVVCVCICMHVDGKLQEQLNAVRKEITRLEYQNNELEQVRLHQSVW